MAAWNGNEAANIEWDLGNEPAERVTVSPRRGRTRAPAIAALVVSSLLILAVVTSGA